MHKILHATQYIFASSSPRYLQYFEELSANSIDKWIWVSEPTELEHVLQQKNPRYIFFIHWNWLVPERVWKTNECVCFHMTDVPFGRGGSPLQNLILAGHSSTKLTALRMVRDMDAGPVYAKRNLKLNGTAEQIYMRAGELGLEIIDWIASEEPNPVEQEGEVVNFKRRTPAQSELPSTGEIKGLYDFIRMLDADGYPHAFLQHGSFRLEFTESGTEGDAVVAKVRITLKPQKEIPDDN